MFVRETLTATQIPAFKNYLKKLEKSIDTIPDTLLKTVEIRQTINLWQIFYMLPDSNQNALPIDILSSYHNKVKKKPHNLLFREFIITGFYNNFIKLVFLFLYSIFI